MLTKEGIATNTGYAGPTPIPSNPELYSNFVFPVPISKRRREVGPTLNLLCLLLMR